MIEAWTTARDSVAHAVALSHAKDGFPVLMFPHASDKHRAGVLTQVPQDELKRGVPVEDLPHEPLAFLSGTFKHLRGGGQLSTKKVSPSSARVKGWANCCGEV